MTYAEKHQEGVPMPPEDYISLISVGTIHLYPPSRYKCSGFEPALEKCYSQLQKSKCY